MKTNAFRGGEAAIILKTSNIRNSVNGPKDTRK
jgi:hypothetical protein